MKYRAAILERDRAVQLLRMVEAYQAIQCRVENVGNNPDERRKLDDAIKILDGLRNCESRSSP